MPSLFVKTVTICHPNDPNGKMIINESDYCPTVHRLWPPKEESKQVFKIIDEPVAEVTAQPVAQVDLSTMSKPELLKLALEELNIKLDNRKSINTIISDIQFYREKHNQEK